MFSATDELVVPTSRWKLAGIAAASACFVAAGAWMLSLVPQAGLLLGAVGLASVTFFGACGAYAVVRLAKPTPAVLINSRGIVDNASAVGVGFIGWDEIEELRECRFMDEVYLGVFPADLDAILARQPAWKRAAIKANLRLGVAPVNIPQVVLPVSVSSLLSEIETRFRGRRDA